MIRMHPSTAAWTALHISITGLATWLLVATEAFNSAAPLLFH